MLYEGKPVGTPDAGALWRVIQDNKVVALFTAPTAFRAVRKEDPEGLLIANYDLSHFRTLFLAGERADPDTIKWAEAKLDRPVIDHWWQTETGWAIAGNPVGLGAMPVKLGSPGLPMPGYDIHVVNDEGQPVAAGDLGNIVVKLPLPPSCLPTLWNAEARCRSTYFETFPGYYATSDAGFIDEDGYVFIMARTDSARGQALAPSPRFRAWALLGRRHHHAPARVPCNGVRQTCTNAQVSIFAARVRSKFVAVWPQKSTPRCSEETSH